MPKYLALTPQQVTELRSLGAEPSEYVFDADTGEAVPKAEVPTTWSEELGAGLKSILPGIAYAVLSPLSLAGQTADLLRQGVGTYDPNDPSKWTQLARSAKEGIVDLVGEPDPRASWLSTGVGRGLGNLAGIATPAALGKKAVSKVAELGATSLAGNIARNLPAVTASRLAGGIGGSMMAESTIDREVQQQAEAGVQDPAKAALKGLISGAVGGYVESKFGAGNILRNLTKPTGSHGSRLGRGLAAFGSGGVTEGLQQGLENELVTGSLQLGDPRFDPTRAALIGSLVQGPTSVALDTLAGKPKAPAEAAAPVGEASKTGLSGLRTGRVKPTATPEDTQGAPAYSPAPGVVEAMLKAGKEWNPPIKTPVASAFKKLADQNVIVTPEDIHSLYNIWGGKAENAKAVEAAANDIYARNVMNDVQKPKSTLDVINAELDVRGKYNKTRENLQAELAKLDKKDADLQKTIAENPAAMGTITAANAELARNAAQRKVYEGLLTELDNQEMLELSANQPKLPTKGMANPVIPAGALPGIGETGVEMPSHVTGPAIPMPEKQPTGALPNIGITEGTPVKKPINPVKSEGGLLEGEQGSPFGESSTRYSGFNLRPMLEAGKEALRRGRKWLTPDQVQAGTYMLSGVAGLNNERPWGMQVGKDGSLPVSGLVPKMAANIPKGEMEAYKAAGLEKWLGGKGKVGRDELQNWMMENGPQVEVKELRPEGTDPRDKRIAQIEHNLELLGVRTSGYRDTETGLPTLMFPGRTEVLFRNGETFAQTPKGLVPWTPFSETPAQNAELIEFFKLHEERLRTGGFSAAGRSDSTIGRYNVEPRPVEEMEGPVELLVRVPGGPKWTGGHHGDSGRNTLGFGRANVETLPDGRKVLHVFEAQSDWGQRVRKEREEGRSDIPSHPLLDESNRLILKAAIKYALDNNLDGIAISDAETAMITEGHDAAGGMITRVNPQHYTVRHDGEAGHFGSDWADGTYVVAQGGRIPPVPLRVDKPEVNSRYKEYAQELHDAGYGQKEGAYIPQEGGMRLNYDQKLPKIAKELTGFEGERVSFGEHWKTLKDRTESQAALYGGESGKQPRQNLIFRNPDGTPKTDITARVYPLDKARKMFEDQTAFTLFGRDQSYYSGLPVPRLKWINDLFTSLGLKNLSSPDPLYHLGKSVTSRMATRGPSGGLVKWLFADMTREKQQIANVLTEATEPFREFVNTENGINWINRASTDETWDDFSGLSKEEIPAAQAYAQFWSDLRDLITDRGVYVMEVDPTTGKVTPRPGQKLPGYTPWSVGDHIYEMAGDKNRAAEWEQAQEDFVEKWKEKFGENSDNMAREAIANILGVKGMETGPGGEPLFGPVSLPHGMTLPESWRDPRPADSLNRYIRRVSQHLAWAEKVQYNPAARRVFNIKADPMGVDTSKTDPTTWVEAPEAWAYAVREGKRVRADWALEADEKAPPDEVIDFAGDSANMNALLSSFKQASSPNPNLQAFSSAASAALMQAPTGLRDVGMSLVRAAQYAGPSAALRASMDYIANIPAKLAEARRAGAMPSDLLEPEVVANSKAIARGLMKVARKMRAWSGREFLDNTGRVIIYDAVKSVILEGNGDHLVKEFGPAFTEGLSKEEIADQTAAVLSHRASNVSDAGSLPAGMLPQGGGLSAPLSLMRWSVAQYNTFAEDVVNPMLDGKGELGMKRFLTLVLGSIVGGSVINGLLDDLLKRKPDHLTWGEWLNVYNDPSVDKATKAKEFAYAAASRAQVMGALGWVGDYLVAPAAREIAGGTRWANQTDIQYPAWIVGNQMARTIGSYYNAVVNKRTDGRDFLDFLLELGKINQNVRVAHGAIKNMQGEEKKGLRDQGVVERVYGLNSSTGKEAGLETGMGRVFRSDPFNFTRQAMGSEDLGKLEGFLEERRRTGQVPVLDEWSQDRRYYQALERLVGEEEAKKRREVDRRMDQEVRKKNREIRRLSR